MWELKPEYRHYKTDEKPADGVKEESEDSS